MKEEQRPKKMEPPKFPIFVGDYGYTIKQIEAWKKEVVKQLQKLNENDKKELERISSASFVYEDAMIRRTNFLEGCIAARNKVLEWLK